MGHVGPLQTLTIATCVGVALFAFSARLRVPPIALLLPAGVLLGPEFLGWVQPSSLGGGMSTVVGLTVAVILFEGGLALDLEGYRRAGTVIVRMLTGGVLLTFAGGALALWYFLDLPPNLAIIGGALVVVTGPTVVSPILRRVGVQQRLSDILYWEGVLVDFVGVFLTVLCFEWATSVEGTPGFYALGTFGLRLVVGAGIGLVAGLLVDFLLRRHLIGPEHDNIMTLAIALLAFGLCDAIVAESGILAVIVAGMVIAIRKPPQFKKLKHFKLELTELGIGLLFILLSANLKLEAFAELGWGGLSVIGCLVFVLRPLNVWLSTAGQGFQTREKLFLTWIAPRGIVAASMASLFSLELTKLGYEQAAVLETYTYAVIATTVLVQGLSAGQVARWLRLKKPPRNRWLVVGDAALVRPVAEAMVEAGTPVAVVVEPGEPMPAISRARWLQGDPLDHDLLTNPELLDVGYVLAVSPNPHLNELVCQLWAEVIPRRNCAPWSPFEKAGDEGPIKQLQSVWPDLPGPSDIAHALETNTQSVEVLEIEEASDLERFGPHLVPLLVARDDTMSLAVGPPQLGDRVVTLRDRVPGLAGLIRSAVVIDRPVSGLDEVVRQLLDAAEVAGDHDALANAILARERDLPTAMGMGVVLPHTYVEGAERAQCLLALVPSGVPGDTPDGKPIKLVCLMLSPAGRAERHLQALASVARLLYDSGFVDVLLAQTSPEALMRRVRDRE
jgi:NhaP-type Na+/H+ or K+/H+ antiporter/mannitol/fructose-specific phosphotransferase system IIA component (Ntr-type)